MSYTIFEFFFRIFLRTAADHSLRNIDLHYVMLKENRNEKKIQGKLQV